MGRKARIGITRDFLDKDGHWVMPGPGLKVLDEMPDVQYRIFTEYLAEVTPEQIEGLDIVINLIPRWTEHTIAGNEQILAVLRRGVGYDNIDVSAVTRAGTMLTTTPQASRRPMATAIIALMLALSLRLLEKDRLTREGRWADRTGVVGYGLPGKTLGSIGVGNIGSEVFRLARPFDMKHIAFDPYITQEKVADIDVTLVDMDTVLTESDFLNISCPLSEETYHLIGEKELGRMKETAFLINAGRGAIVAETALVKALQGGVIRGAAIDVFEQEPASPDNPLFKMDNVIVTPHTIGWTDRIFMDQWDEMMRQVSQIVRGEIPNGLVNRDVLDNPQFQFKFQRFQESLAD